MIMEKAIIKKFPWMEISWTESAAQLLWMENIWGKEIFTIIGRTLNFTNGVADTICLIKGNISIEIVCISFISKT